MPSIPSPTRPRLYLIDGYALIYRAFFAMISRPLTTSKGENTSAAWGIAKFVKKVLEEHRPDYIAFVLDAGTSHREALYPEYKATREKMPTELEASLPRIEELVTAFRVPVVELADHEADDVIGTLALRAVKAGLEAVIVSGDKDFYQLIRDGICLLNPGRGGPAGVEEEWVDAGNAKQRLGVAPERVADYLALIGDASDNVPGAPGIGPKTAIQLIEAFGPVEEILAHAERIPGKRARESLLAHGPAVRLSKQLVTIMTELPLPVDIESLRVREPDAERLRQLFVELEFHSLVRDYMPAERSSTVARDYRTVDTVAGVRELVGMIRAAGRCAFDVEATSLDPTRAGLVGMSFALEPGRAWYLPFGHRVRGGLALEGEDVRNLPRLDSPELAELVALLEDAGVAKTGQNLKYDLLVLRGQGVTLAGIDFDTMLASYLIDPGRREHGLDALALQYLDYRTTTYQELCGRGRDELPIAECAVERVRDYACEDADVALRLAELFAAELRKYELEPLFRTLELPLMAVLADMEWAGIRIDSGFFHGLSRKFGAELELIRQEVQKLAGVEFNLNSTQQLREVLFERLGLPVIKRTKTGASTDVSVLEELAAQGHAIPRLLMEYRQLDKLKGTYLDTLPQLVNPRTGRIHTSFNQAVAATGRLSSSDPNLQNIPIRTDAGAELRKGFIPADGFLFLTADYSQIELRILAHLSGDPLFVDAFRRGLDVHRQTAALVFGVPIDAVTADMRATAKTINFATIYGIGPFALAQKLGTTHAEAKRFIDEYFARLPGVRAYLDRQIALVHERGWVETLAGRRRYIPEVKSRNYSIRQFGERAATNAPVQGTAADIIKRAMIDIHTALRDAGTGARMLVQVHDELMFEAPIGEVDDVRALVVGWMARAFPLDVPLEVASGVGENWYECK
jgi:DNA polymerase I